MAILSMIILCLLLYDMCYAVYTIINLFYCPLHVRNNNICTLCPWCKNPIDNKIFKQIGYSYNQPNTIVINRISDRNRFIYVNRGRYQDNSLVVNCQVCCIIFVILLVGVCCYFLAYWVPKD